MGLEEQRDTIAGVISSDCFFTLQHFFPLPSSFVFFWDAYPLDFCVSLIFRLFIW